VARIHAILRRSAMRQTLPGTQDAISSGQSQIVDRGRLVMDRDRHHVTWNGRAVSLTVTEFLILEALATRPGVIKSRNQLMDAAYPDDVFVDDRTVDSHIKRMRRKFRSVDPQFEAIDTLYGAGYSYIDG
ncbi:MAG: winged helix-turn-helix domain-containing protein, partial [Sphingomonadaceae bacterium]